METEIVEVVVMVTVVMQEVGMVGLYGSSHHQVGRLDEIARLGRWLVIGDLETNRAGEVGGQVGGAGPPEARPSPRPIRPKAHARPGLCPARFWKSANPQIHKFGIPPQKKKREHSQNPNPCCPK